MKEISYLFYQVFTCNESQLEDDVNHAYVSGSASRTLGIELIIVDF